MRRLPGGAGPTSPPRPLEGDHALVVGGTGMLAAATLHLADRYAAVTVASRGARKFCRAHEKDVTGHLVSAPVDYRDTDAFRKTVRRRQRARPFELAVLWIHSSAPAALHAVLDTLAETGRPCRVIRVLGSSRNSAQDSSTEGSWDTSLSVQHVILGYQREADGARRWLTHAEICEGVLGALLEGHPMSVVGTVEP